MISHLQMVTIYVSDLERSVLFYTEKLGFIKVAEFFDAETKMVWVLSPEARDSLHAAEIALCEVPAPDPRIGAVSGMVFTAVDIEATYLELKAKGVNFTLDLIRHKYGSDDGDQEARFIDPDGNEFLLHT